MHWFRNRVMSRMASLLTNIALYVPPVGNLTGECQAPTTSLLHACLVSVLLLVTHTTSRIVTLQLMPFGDLYWCLLFLSVIFCPLLRRLLILVRMQLVPTQHACQERLHLVGIAAAAVAKQTVSSSTRLLQHRTSGGLGRSRSSKAAVSSSCGADSNHSSQHSPHKARASSRSSRRVVP